MKKYYQQVEDQLDKYIEFWHNKSNFKLVNEGLGLSESNDGGREDLQIFRNFDIATFSYEDVCNLSWLVTRELSVQINRDHFFYWTWVQSIAFYLHARLDLRSKNSFFADFDWIEGFNSLANLLILKFSFINPNYISSDSIFFGLIKDKYLIAGPLSYAILEGLLRRKNSMYVNVAGQVINPFKIHVDKTERSFDPLGKNGSKQVNQLKYQLAIFEQLNIPNHRNNRQCLGLTELKRETEKLFPNENKFDDLISDGRNTLLHGNEYWQNKAPIIMNLICLLVIDMIEPLKYANIASELNKTVKFGFRGNLLYPPSIAV